MEPSTPRKPTAKPPSLTPSFTFGLGHSPSFRFTSPRNLNLLTSLSPSRFFVRGNKSSSELDNLSLKKELLPPPFLQHGDAEVLDIPHHEPLIRDDAHSDSLSSATPMDMWSFNETRSVTGNMTSINEAQDEKDVFYSPNEFLIEQGQSPKPMTQPRKRSFPGNQALSPCKRLAAKIEELSNSPGGVSLESFEDETDSKKVWTLSLDNVLLKCQKNYKEFRNSNKSDSSMFKYTTQNKILSKMLLNKTGIFRSAKQISARLHRLQRQPPFSEETSETSFSQQTANLDEPPTDSLEHSTAAATSSGQSVESKASLLELKISFDYKNKNQAPHVFTSFRSKALSNPSAKHSIDDLDRFISQSGTKVASDLKDLARGLVEQELDVHIITSPMNTEPESGLSPSSPTMTSKSIAADNGRFSSFSKISIEREESQESIIPLCSSIIIYQDGEYVLSQTTESVNGYRRSGTKYEVHAPFSRNFWAGYLTFLINGSNDFDDLSRLTIVQKIHDADPSSQTIYAYFIFKFDPTLPQSEPTNVRSYRLLASIDEADEMETIMAPSPQTKMSPCKSDTPRANLRINTTFDDTFIPEAPNTAPIYNSHIMQKYNFNYVNGMNRPFPGRSQSAVYTQHEPPTNFYPYNQPVMMSQTPTNFSAGQMWNNGLHNQPMPSNYLDVSPQASSTPVAPSFPTPQFIPHEPPHSALPISMPLQPTAQHNLPMASPQDCKFEQQHQERNASVEPKRASSSGPQPQGKWTVASKSDHTSKPKGGIKFESIMQYDPSRSSKQGTKKSNASPSFHSFRSSRRFIVKSHKN